MSDRPPLKEIFDATQFMRIGDLVKSVWRPFDLERFLAESLAGLDGLSVMQRVRRASDALSVNLPAEFPAALDVLFEVAPRIEKPFVALFLSDFVGQHGKSDFALSMNALRYFTQFGSSEFAVREFLKHRLQDTLDVMKAWAEDDNEHVRRLASEGSRPRLPWSFRLPAILSDPALTEPILTRLNQDPSLYVRKSVANHLNDISKDHPQWMLELLGRWPLSNLRTTWIAKHSLRGLIKAGHRDALNLIGATEAVQVEVVAFIAAPKHLQLGEELVLTVDLRSQSDVAQKIVIDYRIHYLKKSGSYSPKVFKLRTLELAPQAVIRIEHRRLFKDFTTRTHYAGAHQVDLLVNGDVRGTMTFSVER